MYSHFSTEAKGKVLVEQRRSRPWNFPSRCRKYNACDAAHSQRFALYISFKQTALPFGYRSARDGFALAAGRATLCHLPEGVIELILQQLQPADQARMRLSCKQLASLAGKHVASVSKKTVSLRELLRAQAVFSGLRHLQLSEPLSGRCAAALVRLRSLNISHVSLPQRLSSLSVLSELAALRIAGAVPDIDELRCLPTLTKLCLPNELLPLQALASLTRLQSLAAYRFTDKDMNNDGFEVHFSSEQRLGLTSLCLLDMMWVPSVEQLQLLAAICELTSLQVLRLRTTISGSELSTCQALHSLQIAGSSEVPACMQLTLLKWDCELTSRLDLPPLESLSRLREFHCTMPFSQGSIVCSTAFPLGLTSLCFSGVLEGASIAHMQNALFQLLHLRALRVNVAGPFSANALLHDSNNFKVSPDAVPLDACEIEVDCISDVRTLRKGDVDSLLSRPRFADSWEYAI